MIVDADGRLHPEAPRYAASHFAATPRLAACSRSCASTTAQRLLTWLPGRRVRRLRAASTRRAGTPGGRRGWAATASSTGWRALDAVADHAGPWRDRLTEDQDLGLRLIGAGWKGRQELRAVVDQQGLSELRPLFRQRTRWSQGNLQAMGLLARRVAGAGGARPRSSRSPTC